MLKKNLSSITTLIALLFAGCSGNTSPVPFGVENARLEIIGSDSVSMDQDDEIELKVRYVDADNNNRIVDGQVSFEIDGQTNGASLSGRSDLTDETGVASIILRSSQEAEFDVVASAALVDDPAVINVRVAIGESGEIEYTVTYTGTRTVRTAEVGLFANTSCDDLARRVPSAAAAAEARIGEGGTFDHVEIGTPMAVYAIGIDSGEHVAAETCGDITLDAETGTVNLMLADMGALISGTYDITSTYDFTTAFPKELDQTLDFITDLSEGNPGRAITGLLDSLDAWPNDFDLKLTGNFLEDLWKTVVRTILEEAVDQALAAAWGGIEDAGNGGEGFTNSVEVAGGIVNVLNTTMENLRITSELSIETPNAEGVAEGTHTLRDIQITYLDQNVDLPISGDADVMVTVAGDNVTLSQHQLGFTLGQLITNVLSILLQGQDEDTLGAVIADAIPCEAIAEAAESQGKNNGNATVRQFFGDFGEKVCEILVPAVGAAIDLSITQLTYYETLELDMTAELVDDDGDYDRETVQEGETAARWFGVNDETQDEVETDFTGTFTGTRQDDEEGASHPVREKIQAALTT